MFIHIYIYIYIYIYSGHLDGQHVLLHCEGARIQRLQERLAPRGACVHVRYCLHLPDAEKKKMMTLKKIDGRKEKFDVFHMKVTNAEARLWP